MASAPTFRILNADGSTTGYSGVVYPAQGIARAQVVPNSTPGQTPTAVPAATGGIGTRGVVLLGILLLLLL